jgi:cytoskeletal protein RodZ
MAVTEPECVPDDDASLGEVLHRHREAAGLSQEGLAARSQVSVDTISNLERGRVRRPHASTIRRLASALQLDSASRRALLDLVQPAAPPSTAPMTPPSPRTRRQMPGLMGVASVLVSLLVGSGTTALALTHVLTISPRAIMVTPRPTPAGTTEPSARPSSAAVAPGSGSAPQPSTPASPGSGQSPPTVVQFGGPPGGGTVATSTPARNALLAASAQSRAPAPTLSPARVAAPAPAPALRFSFEDGGTDGWDGHGQRPVVTFTWVD